MSSIAARTYLTPEEYIAAERKATLKSEYLLFQSRQNFPYARFTDSLNWKLMPPFKLPVASKRGNLSHVDR